MDDISRRIVELVQAGQKIEAIKLYRETTGSDLKTAKDEVDRIAARLAGEAVPPPPDRQEVDPLVLDTMVRTLIAEGKKIEAIKLVREKTGLGLKESKDRVDAIAGPSATGAGCLGSLLFVALLTGGALVWFAYIARLAAA